MTVIARDAVASDHLVYAWPLPIGPECEVTCADDEQVVMCPAWLVGDRLGPGHHLWRTPDPTRPVSAFFVLVAPVEVSFDMTTMFIIPATGQPIRLRAVGSLQVRCVDPGLLIAQFVGLPFDRVNEGILRSVSRSVERMLARLLTRRVVMAGTPLAVTDTGMLSGIVEELVAYNPTAGAVFGVELIRMGHLTIVADDGSSPQILLPNENDWSDGPTHNAVANGDARSAALKIAHRVGEVPLTETARGRPGTNEPVVTRSRLASSPEIMTVNPTPPPTTVSGEIRARAGSPRDFGRPVVDQPAPPFGGAASRGQGAVVEVPQSTDDITQPGVNSPLPGAMRGASGTGQLRPEPPPAASFGVGLSPIGGSSAISGEIVPRVPPGARVLVPGPNGLMQSATVRQLLQGYYELEVGSSGETIWVPTNGVVPEH